MLVLSRYRDECVMIADDVKVTVVSVCGEKVRLGIEAPKDVPVHRQEVYEAIKREQENKPDGIEHQPIKYHNRNVRTELNRLIEQLGVDKSIEILQGSVTA